MKIWLRTGKANLTNGGRTMYGIAISHDGVRDAFNRMGVECFDEYPSGDAITAVNHIPQHPEEYLSMWYGDPALWGMGDGKGRGIVGYTRSGETIFNDVMKTKLNRCDLVFVASTAAQRCFAEQLDVPVYVLSGGVEPRLFPFMRRDYDTKPIRFLHVGATHWRKGSDRACEAFALAFDNNADAVLIILSSGETEMFQHLREKYRHDDRYIFGINPVSDRSQMASQYYAQGHCLVYPSINEGWGRCLAEAMFTGMPVICFRASSMLDQFDDSCGWWIEPEAEKLGMYILPSVDDLADKMFYAYSNPDECTRKGKDAAFFARKHLTWDVGIRKALPSLQRVYDNG
jgi:glycosyltransferase involved in cell wall biosynthesis